nr:MAG TPA: hypothetical protein [Caudoviricetes sp.]
MLYSYYYINLIPHPLYGFIIICYIIINQCLRILMYYISITIASKYITKSLIIRVLRSARISIRWEYCYKFKVSLIGIIYIILNKCTIYIC